MWALFSAANRMVAGDGWKGGMTGAILGSINLNLSDARPAGRPRLWVISILGTVNVILPAGYSAAVGGVSLLGAFNGRRDGGAEPAVRVTCINLMGTVNIQ